MRPAAALVALVTLASLLAQGIVLSRAMPGATSAAVLWSMAAFFTNLTNALVAGTFLWVAATGRRGGPVWMGGITLWIVAVGVVYRLLLSALYDPEGLAMWADQGRHTAVPALVLLWWLSFATKARLGWPAVALWLVWPLAYCLYALIRGAMTGFYPYYFLDPGMIGPDGVALSVAGLGAGFALGGAALVGGARLLPRR